LCDNFNKPLYPDCVKFNKISTVFKLYNLKIINWWSDNSFTSLLKLLWDVLPNNNELPDSTYKVKKLLRPLSMKVERIHACTNDCILYWNGYSDMNKCPKCNDSWYKLKND
jgi:hypothetical protein